jgi:uncharacterized protein YgiM (DUF1202 family)
MREKLKNLQNLYLIMTCVSVLLMFAGCGSMQENVISAFQPNKTSEASESGVFGFVVYVKQDLPVRSQPSFNSESLGNLYLGDKVIINQVEPQWYQITRIDEVAASKLNGWVEEEYIEKLEGDERKAESYIEIAYLRKSSELPEDNKKLNEMRIRTIRQGIVGGALFGAVIGGAVAASTGKNVGKGALVGAGAGSLLGTIGGITTANKKEGYAEDEEKLNLGIEEAYQFNQAAQVHNQSLRQAILVAEEEIEIIRDKITDTGIRQQRAHVDIRSLKKLTEETDQVILNLENLTATQQKALENTDIQNQNLKKLEQQVMESRRQIEDMKMSRNRLGELLGEFGDLTV